MSAAAEVNVSVKQISATASQGQAREHTLIMDRPESKGGENRGAMGGENLLMALGGCYMSNLLAAARSREIGLTDVQLDISGRLDTAPPRFAAIKMKISASCPDRQEMEKLVTIAERGCIVANTLKQAAEVQITLT